MRAKRCVCILIYVFLFVGASYSGDWANSYGSCYQKGSKNISCGMSLLFFGPFAEFDYGFHDAISGGGAIGLMTNFDPDWNYNLMPIVVRAAFHPFNLNVLTDKINVRNKLDVYAGLATGGRIEWVSWKGSGTKPPEPESVYNGFFIREYIGIRFFPTYNFYLLAEEGSGLGVLNLGFGFKF